MIVSFVRQKLADYDKYRSSSGEGERPVCPLEVYTHLLGPVECREQGKDVVHFLSELEERAYIYDPNPTDCLFKKDQRCARSCTTWMRLPVGRYLTYMSRPRGETWVPNPLHLKNGIELQDKVSSDHVVVYTGSSPSSNSSRVC